MADSSIPITPGSGANVDTRTTANGDHREVVVVGDPTADNVAKVGTGGEQWAGITSPAMSPFGVFARITPFAALRVTGEPTTIFWDVFDGTVIDTQKWTTSGSTNVPVQTGGAMSVSAGTTLNAESLLNSVPTFSANGTGYNAFASVITLESSPVAGSNQHRFWGVGTAGGFNGPILPANDACGFEIDSSGALNCIVIVGGTRYVVNSTNASLISSSVAGAGGSGTAVPSGATVSNLGSILTWQGGSHRFGMHFRADSVFFYVEGQDKPVGIANYLMPNTQTLPIKVAARNNSSGTVSSSLTFQVNSIAIADTTAGNHTISDPDYPWRRAEVGKNGGLSVRGATVASVSGNIAACTTGTIGPADVSEAGNCTIVVKNTNAASPWTGTPVLVFEQSDDGTSWAPMPMQRADTNAVSTTATLPAGIANTEYVFNCPLQGAQWVRARVTTGPATNGMTVVIIPGGGYFVPFVNVAQPQRNLVTLFTATPVALTATDTLVSLTGWKSGAAVAATTTPAVVSAGKTFRVTGITASYVSTTTSAYLLARLRVNTAGVVAIGSPIVKSIVSGATSSVTVANYVGFNPSAATDGIEFAAGSGIGVSFQGLSGVTGTAGGYGHIEITGYEY